MLNSNQYFFNFVRRLFKFAGRPLDWRNPFPNPDQQFSSVNCLITKNYAVILFLAAANLSSIVSIGVGYSLNLMISINLELTLNQTDFNQLEHQRTLIHSR